jgi:hypothetical protein
MSTRLDRSARSSTVADLLRRIGSEMPNVEDSQSRAELLARILWDLALNGQVVLPSNKEIKLSNALWMNVVFRVIERMEGKPMQPMSQDMGVTIVRGERFAKATPADIKREKLQFQEVNRELSNVVGVQHELQSEPVKEVIDV